VALDAGFASEFAAIYKDLRAELGQPRGNTGGGKITIRELVEDKL
jgi:hypothetical protein